MADVVKGKTRAARAQIDQRALRKQTKQQRRIERIIARENGAAARAEREDATDSGRDA